jgi:hypothetical protein
VFVQQNDLLLTNPTQLQYGIAVTDVDGDGRFELFVAGFGFPNLVLKWNGEGFIDSASEVLADDQRRAIGVAACDIDGDGREEIYVLNTDTFAGRKRFGDRLFALRDGSWIDLCTLPENSTQLNLTAGRSVACVDRDGDGRYGFFVANYGGPLRLYELDTQGRLYDAAPDAKLNLVTGGRGVVALPLISERIDIFAANEQSPNFLFQNQGNGTFEEVAHALGLSDPHEHGRGVAVLDSTGNGRFDLVYGNWEGPHRLFVQSAQGSFREMAPPAMAEPSRVRTVIAADFDNDGYEEIFFNNIGQPNRLFGRQTGQWAALDPGDALEPAGLGTGAAVGDFDGDGRLELLIAHGEAAAQPLTLYHARDNGNNWLRVLPLTLQGAPARGVVVLLLAGRRWQRRAIDAGSGYLCQMEPVAHFGLGQHEHVERVVVRWLDGAVAVVDRPRINTQLRVPYPVYTR